MITAGVLRGFEGSAAGCMFSDVGAPPGSNPFIDGFEGTSALRTAAADPVFVGFDGSAVTSLGATVAVVIDSSSGFVKLDDLALTPLITDSKGARSAAIGCAAGRLTGSDVFAGFEGSSAFWAAANATRFDSGFAGFDGSPRRAVFLAAVSSSGFDGFDGLTV
jgi:hypothetical protein